MAVRVTLDAWMLTLMASVILALLMAQLVGCSPSMHGALAYISSTTQLVRQHTAMLMSALRMGTLGLPSASEASCDT